MARRDPVPALRFYLEIDNIIEAGFTECKGLGVKWKVFKYKEGGVNNYVHQLPERAEYPKITLRRGITWSETLWQWSMQGMYDGKVDQKNVSIVLLDAAGEEVRRWNLARAYPIKWTGPQLKADSKKVAIETLEIVHHGLTLSEGTRGSA